MNNIDYNTNVHPLLTSYNHTNDGKLPLIPSDNKSNNSLTYLRGYGLYNPAPLDIQTIDRGHAFSSINPKTNIFNQSYVPESGDVYINPSGAVEIDGTWEKNINYNIKKENIDNNNYKYYDEYQTWAYNVTRKSDPYILPYLFSKINIKFIQDSVVEYVKNARNIKINTKQDIDGLLHLVLSAYNLYYDSNGIFSDNSCSNSAFENKSCNFSNILGNLNKYIIEIYVKNILSGLNMNEYYIKDISTLPVPLSNPVLVSNKGSKVLGYVGPFENNQEFTNNINSFNSRDLIPKKINAVSFGN